MELVTSSIMGMGSLLNFIRLIDSTPLALYPFRLGPLLCIATGPTEAMLPADAMISPRIAMVAPSGPMPVGASTGTGPSEVVVLVLTLVSLVSIGALMSTPWVVVVAGAPWAFPRRCFVLLAYAANLCPSWMRSWGTLMGATRTTSQRSAGSPLPTA